MPNEASLSEAQWYTIEVSLLPMTHLARFPLLIVDKEGTLGKELAQRLQESFLTVFVSRQQAIGDNIIPIPFQKKIPTIPDNSFSHIIIIYSGEKELQESFSSFVKKAKEKDAWLILITSIFHYNDQLASRLFETYEKTQVIVVGDLFPRTQIPSGTPATSLLFQAKNYGRIELSHSGLELLFPLAMEDAIDGIIRAIFSESEARQLYACLPPFPLTQLSFAHLLQKLYPLLQVDFSKKKVNSPVYHLPSAARPLFESYPLEKRLREVDLISAPTAKNKKIARIRSKHDSQNSSKRPFFFTVSLFFFIIALPFLLTIGSALAGGMLLKQAEAEASQGRLTDALRSARGASTFLSLADDTAVTLRSIVSVVGLDQEVIGFQTLIHTGRELSDASTQLLSSASQLQTLIGSTKPARKEDYLEAINRLKQGVISLQSIQAEGNLPLPYQERLRSLQSPLSLLTSLVDASPELLGFNESKRYLILFQNNFELRPAGGFIGSYGLATLDHGQLKDLTIHDVYDADGKLTANVDPPYPLRRFMGASHWFMRDSNFDPDFARSASQAASFLKLETGENVDGVVGIDVSFLSSLLDATGPITLPDYNETITKENFYLLTQSKAENNFFPGSTQKKDFLRAAETELLNRLQRRSFSYEKFATAVVTAITQKHLLFAFPDLGTQKLFSINNLSGSIAESRGGSATTFLDSLNTNEANIGQNKSNYYLKRSLAQKVTIDGEGVVTEDVILTYTNTSSKSSPFGGDYKAYLRLLTPDGTTLTGIQIDGSTQVIVSAVTDENTYLSRSFKPPKGLEVEEGKIQGKIYFGTLITVPAGQTRIMTFSYRLQNRVPIESPEWQYDLLSFKQPGTISDPYSLEINYPVAVRLFKSSLPVGDVGGKLTFSSDLSEDRRLILNFIQR